MKHLFCLLFMLVFILSFKGVSYAGEDSMADDVTFALKLTELSPIDRIISIIERKNNKKDWDLQFEQDIWESAIKEIKDINTRSLIALAYSCNSIDSLREVSFHLVLACLYKDRGESDKLDKLLREYDYNAKFYWKQGWLRIILKQYYGIGIEFYSETRFDRDKLESWTQRLVKSGINDKFKIPANLFIQSDLKYHYVSPKTILGIIYVKKGNDKEGRKLITEAAKEYIDYVVKSGSFGISADELTYLAYLYQIDNKNDMVDKVTMLNKKMESDFKAKQAKIVEDQVKEWKAIEEWNMKLDALKQKLPGLGQRLEQIEEMIQQADTSSETVYQQIAGRIGALYELNKLLLIFIADRADGGLQTTY